MRFDLLMLFRVWIFAKLVLGLSLAHAQQQTGPQGWAGEDVAAEARKELGKDAPPELLIVGADRADTADSYIALWHFAKRCNGGKHLTNVAQEVGDCVSWGTGNACEYSLAVQIVLGQADGKFREAYPPYIYGASRVQIGGGKIRGDGSVGAWAAKAIEQYGVLAQDEPGVPDYSGSIARDWGKHGPPPNFVTLAKPFTAETRRITDWDDACQSLANGWPIAVCSSAGFGKIVEANNRIEGRWSTSWAHCMCFVAMDTRAGREALYCLNSWGPNAHAAAKRYAELDGAPPGGFWVLKADAEKMLKQGDSHAVSFNGFKPRPKSVYETLQKPGAN